MEAFGRLYDRTGDPFPARPSLIKCVDRVLTVEVNDIEADAGSQPDVGTRMRCPPTPNLIKIRCGVVQSMTAIGCGDQWLLRARR